MKWKNDSLRAKWALWTSLTMIITYIVLAILLLTALSQWLMANERNSAQASMEELQNYMDARGPYLSYQDFERNTGLLNQFLSRNQSARLLNEDGIELLQINPATPFPSFEGPTSQFEEREVKGESILYQAREFQLADESLFIVMSHSLKTYDSMFQYLVWALVLFGFLFVVASGFTGYFLSSLLIQPLKRLKKSMQLTKPGAPLTVTLSEHRHDEIGELITEYENVVDRMSEVYAMQERFIGDVSHELRTPIQAMEGNIDLLLRWGKDDPVLLEETLQVLKEESTKMRILMETLLTIAKQQEVSKEWVNMKEEITKAVEQSLARYPDQDIRADIQPSQIWFSKILFQQVVSNLLQNAFRYSDGRPEVQMTGRQEAAAYVLHIEDKGIGMSEDQLKHIFDPFYTVSDNRSKQHGGAGLGLTIVKQVMERSGGDIQVTSKMGKGTIFTLEFPIVNK